MVFHEESPLFPVFSPKHLPITFKKLSEQLEQPRIAWKNLEKLLSENRASSELCHQLGFSASIRCVSFPPSHFYRFYNLKTSWNLHLSLAGASPIEEDDRRALRAHFLLPQTSFLFHSTSIETRRRGTFITPWRDVSLSSETRRKTSSASLVFK